MELNLYSELETRSEERRAIRKHGGRESCKRKCAEEANGKTNWETQGR